MMLKTQAEYIWLDGAKPTQKLRSKTRIVAVPGDGSLTIESFPEWSFDGSSTYQATGSDSDLILRPVRFVSDPLRGDNNYLVLCEVFNSDGTAHSTNSRALLREVLEAHASEQDFWIGFEQEYALVKGKQPLGFPDDGYPGPQGPYYCSVGSDVAFGRRMVEAHTNACLAAGIMIYGINAEVLPGQWEFQIGYRGMEGESADPLTVADHLWIARWLLYRIGEDFGVVPSFVAKPVKGDWNGSGMHTNFSSAATRNPATGMAAIERAINRLRVEHAAHIAVYGDGLADRLTGQHETCSIYEFRNGISDRGASVRIPLNVAAKGFGYLEDRRPAANADPYKVSARILETVSNPTIMEHENGSPKSALWKTGSLAPWQQPSIEMSDPYFGE